MALMVVVFDERTWKTRTNAAAVRILYPAVPTAFIHDLGTAIFQAGFLGYEESATPSDESMEI